MLYIIWILETLPPYKLFYLASLNSFDQHQIANPIKFETNIPMLEF